ncbi:MAG: hypothetical protein AAGE96_03465 [Cyanobacteria bacterium P01_G01_bin.19]
MLTVTTAKAGSSQNLDSLNGLFTPTQSERFFQAGRENFEREIEIFTHPEKYLRSDVLKIDPEAIKQMDRSQFYSDYDWDNSPYKLHIDIIELE